MWKPTCAKRAARKVARDRLVASVRPASLAASGDADVLRYGRAPPRGVACGRRGRFIAGGPEVGRGNFRVRAKNHDLRTSAGMVGNPDRSTPPHATPNRFNGSVNAPRCRRNACARAPQTIAGSSPRMAPRRSELTFALSARSHGRLPDNQQRCGSAPAPEMIGPDASEKQTGKTNGTGPIICRSRYLF
jgi:hypothetical protein